MTEQEKQKLKDALIEAKHIHPTEYDDEGAFVGICFSDLVDIISGVMNNTGWHPVSEPPILDAPYISVVFCKGRNGWLPFTGYGCDISPKKTVEFINRINDAADVLNGKEKEK